MTRKVNSGCRVGIRGIGGIEGGGSSSVINFIIIV